MKRLAFAFALLAFVSLHESATLSAQTVSRNTPKLQAAFPGLAGRVFEPGEAVTIRWELSGTGVRHYESHPWGECELLFSADDGETWS